MNTYTVVCVLDSDFEVEPVAVFEGDLDAEMLRTGYYRWCGTANDSADAAAQAVAHLEVALS